MGSPQQSPQTAASFFAHWMREGGPVCYSSFSWRFIIHFFSSSFLLGTIKSLHFFTTWVLLAGSFTWPSPSLHPPLPPWFVIPVWTLRHAERPASGNNVHVYFNAHKYQVDVWVEGGRRNQKEKRERQREERDGKTGCCCCCCSWWLLVNKWSRMEEENKIKVLFFCLLLFLLVFQSWQSEDHECWFTQRLSYFLFLKKEKGIHRPSIVGSTWHRQLDQVFSSVFPLATHSVFLIK